MSAPEGFWGTHEVFRLLLQAVAARDGADENGVIDPPPEAFCCEWEKNRWGRAVRYDNLTMHLLKSAPLWHWTPDIPSPLRINREPRSVHWVASIKSGRLMLFEDDALDPIDGHELLIKDADFSQMAEQIAGLPESATQPFNDDDRRQWMLNCDIKNVDEAYRKYKGETRYCGTKQAAWRQEWQSLFNRSRGRPPDSS